MTRISTSKIKRGKSVTLRVDGVLLEAYEGETIAGALIADGRRSWRHTHQGSPRGIFCGIGYCFDCLVTVDGKPNVRACVTRVAEGMKVTTGERVEATGE